MLLRACGVRVAFFVVGAQSSHHHSVASLWWVGAAVRGIQRVLAFVEVGASQPRCPVPKVDHVRNNPASRSDRANLPKRNAQYITGRRFFMCAFLRHGQVGGAYQDDLGALEPVRCLGNVFGRKQVVGTGHDDDEVPAPAAPPVVGGLLDAYLGGNITALSETQRALYRGKFSSRFPRAVRLCW